MGAQLRVYERRIKIRHRDQEDHPGDGADRRLAHRQGAARVAASQPYAGELTRAVTAVGVTTSTLDHPLTDRARATAAGPPCCSSPATAVWPAATTPTPSRRPRQLTRCCASRGQGGRHLHRRPQGRGATTASASATSRSVDRLHRQPAVRGRQEDRRPADRGVRRAATEEGGVDELHIVYTEFVSMLTQTPVADRLLPLRGRGDGRGGRRSRRRDPAAVRLRAVGRGRARRPAAALRREPDLQRAAPVGRLRARGRAGGR